MTPKATTSVADIVTLTFARLVLNMTRRFTYPFLPEISRQLGVPLDSVQNVMAVNAGVGIASPLLGPIGERFGRKRVMMGALLAIALASLLGAAAPQFALFAAVLIVFGVAKMLFDPAMAAYIADHVPYVRRGAVIGITELSWAGSLLVIAPVAGFLLGASGLQSVFIVIALFNLLALAAIYHYLPADHPTGDAIPRSITPLETWRALRTNPASFGAMGFSMLLVIANEIFFINYAAYMEATFQQALADLGAALAFGAVAALGIVTIVVAAGEVVGEFAVIGLADRFGKRRVALIGAGVSSVCYVLMPLFWSSLLLTLLVVFVIFVALETAIVASIPLFTEILPNARAIMMSSNVGAHSLGRLLGATLGGWLYATLGNFGMTSAIATAIALVSWFLLWRFVHEKQG